MILDLVQKWNVDLDSSFLIGNSARDLEAAHAAGVKGYLYEQGNLLDFLRSSALKTDRDVN
ncbi:HAD hydrolase-like protein [Mycolicibacterium psychrotolerans]|uniref:HAD hydrolase-like protein n=1 Tax=Mycolicibacterium psychrotolerans TaxID=216929 RepID=UPI003D6655DE